MDELERRLGQAKASLTRDVEQMEIPALVNGRVDAGSPRTGGRSYAPFAVAAGLVTMLTVGAFLVARSPADDVLLTEPADSTLDPTTPEPTAPVSPAQPPVVDLEPRSVTPFEAVALGETFTEPDFGTTITRMTASTPGAVTSPASSTSQVFNADSTMLLLYRTGVDSPGHLVVDIATREIVETPDLSAATDIEDIAWDATNPNLLRYIDPTTMSVVEFTVRGDIVIDPVPGECDSADFGASVGAIAGRSATLAIVCRTADSVDWIAYDTSARRVLAQRPAIPTADGSVDAPMTMASGDGFVLIDEESITVLDADLEPTGLVVDAIVSEGTLALDSEGRDVLVASVFDDLDGNLVGTAVVIDLQTGEQRVITGQATGYPYPPTGTSIGIAGGPNSTLVAIVTSPGVSEPGLLEDEVLLVDLVNDTTFRLAHHRMADADAFGNWAKPFVAVSPDGSSVVFSSNLGGNAVDTYLISIPR